MIAKTLMSTLLQKKTRLLLLLFSIAACASLLFANAGFQKTVSQMIYNADTRRSGNSDIIIEPKQSVGAAEWIDPTSVAAYSDKFEYAYQFVSTSAFYMPSAEEMHTFTAWGVEIDELNTYNPLSLEAGSIENWSGNTLILGTTFAQKLGVSVGDTISLEIAGKLQDFQVAGISAPKGLFSRELADGGYLLMPKETLVSLVGGQCNLMFIKVKDTIDAPALMQTLEVDLPQYYVHVGINHAVIQSETNNYTLPFWISSVIVLFMSVFIIYSSFNLIVNERIKLLGILRSIGCSRKRTNGILLLESAIIGAVGGIVGCALGIGILHIIINVYFSGESAVVEAPVLYGFGEVLFTIVAAVIITILSAILPIVRVTKESVKNIILNDFGKRQVKNARLWPLGILLICPCFAVPAVADKGLTGMIVASAAATMALIGLNLLIPALCRLATKAVGKLPYAIWLGVRNAGDFKALVNNIRLFATTLAIMAFMTTIFSTLGNDLVNMSRQNQFDLQITFRQSDPQTLQTLSGVQGVADVYGAYQIPARITSHGTFLNQLVGIDSDAYFDYMPAKIPPETAAALESLNDGNNIVTTDILREKLGLKIGDTLKLQVEGGVHNYTITGFLDTNRGIGHVGYISSERFRTDIGVEYYSRIYVKTDDDPNDVKLNIQRVFTREILAIQTKQELEAADSDKVLGIFNAINTYAYFAMLIGILGIINNMVACFLSRRRNIAMYRCVGMSIQTSGRMLVTEAATIGMIGAFAGLSIGLLMVQTVPYVVGMIWGNVAIAVPWLNLTILCVAGIVAMLLSSLLPRIKSKNSSIMDNIRYE